MKIKSLSIRIKNDIYENLRTDAYKNNIKSLNKVVNKILESYYRGEYVFKNVSNNK